MPGVGEDPTQAGSPPPMMGGDGAPSGTPSGEAVKNHGDIELAKMNVSLAISHLEKQLPLLGMDTEEGKAVHSALGILSKKFSGDKSEDLAPAGLMSMMGSQPDAVKAAMMKEMAAGQGGPALGGPGPQSSPLNLS